MLLDRVTYGVENKEVHDRWNRYEGPLPNMKDIDPRKFWTYFFNYTPKYVAFHRWYDEKTRDWYHVKIFFTDYQAKQGVGVYQKIERAVNVTPDRFFKFGDCDHHYQSKQVGNCLRRYICTKCGHKYEIDSSG